MLTSGTARRPSCHLLPAVRAPRFSKPFLVFGHRRPFIDHSCKASDSSIRAASAAASAPAAATPGAKEDAAVEMNEPRTHFAELFIKDFALVSEQRVHLRPGLTVITGESGSGKSVLVEALGQLLGAPAFDEAVRPPASTAVLEAAVLVAPAERAALRQLLVDLGVPQRACRQLGRLTLRRELVKGADGSVRSRCAINGSPTSVRVLREVGTLLVDVNGQHVALSLKDGAMRVRLLDRLAGTTATADRLSASLAEWQQARAQLRELDALADEEQREAMQRLVDDVQAAGILPGEDRMLRQQLRQLDGRRAAAERSRIVSVGLSGDGGGGIADALREVQLQVKQLLSQEERLAAAQAAADREEEQEQERRQLGAAGRRDVPAVALGVDGGEVEEAPEEAGESAAGMLQASLELLDQAQLLLEDAEEKVLQYAKLYRFSQVEHDELSARLQQLERLMKQHDASSADELLEAAERQEAALDLYFTLEGQRDQLESEAQELERQVQRQALELSQLRREAAGRLRAAVEAVLGDLAMQGSRFDVRIRWAPVSAAALGPSSSLASSGNMGGSMGSISVAIDAAEAAACGEQAGRYRLRPGGAGLDAAEFLFAAGPAEPLRPLSAVASGGENARIMLALKAAPAFMLAASGAPSIGHAGASNDGSVGNGSSGGGSSGGGSSCGAGSRAAGAGQVLVLDEVDSGIGSRLGQPIGRILRRMAGSGGINTGQILCVSHLPQVAAHAEHHLCVRKGVAPDDRVITRFDSLQRRQERLVEISAMLGLPQAAAEELLQAAAQP